MTSARIRLYSNFALHIFLVGLYCTLYKQQKQVKNYWDIFLNAIGNFFPFAILPNFCHAASDI